MSRPSGAALARASRARRLKVELARGALTFYDARAVLVEAPTLEVAKAYADAERAVVRAARALATQRGAGLSDRDVVLLVGPAAMKEIARDLAAMDEIVRDERAW